MTSTALVFVLLAVLSIAGLAVIQPSFLKKLLASAMALLFILGAALGASVGAVAPTPAPSWQTTPALEYRLPASVVAPTAQHSTRAALTAALCGLLTSNRFELAEFEGADQDRYVEALRAVNALVAESRSSDGEAAKLAGAIGQAVEADSVDAVAVVEALATCGDPALGIHAVAYRLGVWRPPLAEAAERIEHLQDAIENVGEILERSRRAKDEEEERKRPRATGSAVG